MTPLTRLVTSAVLPLALLISVVHLVEAEHGPGDGFTAGIISALGLTLDREVFRGRDRDRPFRSIRFELVLMVGVALTLSAAMLPMAAGGSLLAAVDLGVSVPWIGPMTIARATLFDLGIYCVVLGGAMTAIGNLRRERA